MITTGTALKATVTLLRNNILINVFTVPTTEFQCTTTLVLNAPNFEPRKSSKLTNNQNLREQLKKLSKNRKSMRY